MPEAEQIAAFEPYRRDLLLMTVGGNTLPNAVAGPLLVNDGGTIVLIHSEATQPIAQHFLAPVLRARCTEQGLTVTVRLADESVDESAPGSIQRVIDAEIAKENRKKPNKSIGLHYTGGTKAMSVHAFRTVERTNRADTIFSYLNPRKLEVVFEDRKQVYPPLDVRYITVPFTQMLEMHGGKYHDSNAVPQTTPIWLDVARKIAEWNVRGNLGQWMSWKNTAVRLWKEEDKPRRNEKWEARKVRVENVLARHGQIPLQGCPPPIATALRSTISFTGDYLPVSQATASFPNSWHPHIDVYEWLDGKWLEHWGLSQMLTVEEESSLKDVQINVEADFDLRRNIGLNGSELFEIDLVAIRGYQLFLISCGTDPKQAKTKLFEAFNRARQIGGDEARVALLTTHDDPQGVADEASELLLTKGQIKVFGKPDLLHLPDRFRDWMRR